MFNFTKETYNWRSVTLLIGSILAVLIGSWHPSWLSLPLSIGVLGLGIAALFSPTLRQLLPSFAWTDGAVLLLLLSTALNYWYSIYSPNSFVFLQKIHFFTLLYLLLRVNFTLITSRNILFIGLGGYGFLLAVGAFFSFLFLQTQLHFEGWADASQFKRLYSPFGLLNNEWATISLSLLAFPLLAAALLRSSKIAWVVCAVAFALVNASALVSFSRGAYLTLGLFWVVAIGGVALSKALPFKALALSVLVVGILTTLLMLPIRTPFLTTLAMNKTVTQQRSTQGRMDILRSGWCVAKAHLWTGVGGNNYPIVNEQCQTPREDQGYSGFTNNTYLQILIEQGVLGLATYALLFLTMILGFGKAMIQKLTSEERLLKTLLLAGLLTLGFRELFFSALFYSPFVLVLLAVFAAAAAGGTIPKRWQLLAWSKFGIILLLLTTWIFYQNGLQNKAATWAAKAVTAWHQDDQPKALNAIHQALALAPEVAPYHELAGLIEGQSDIPLSDFTKNNLQIDPVATQKAILHFTEASQINPLDAGFLFNLGWLYFLQKDAALAQVYLTRALALEPNNSEFWIGKGVFLEASRDTTKAFEAYAKAVRLDPEIIDSRFFKDLRQRYSASLDHKVESILDEAIDKLESEVNNFKGNPILAARLGKIYLEKDQVFDAKTQSWQRSFITANARSGGIRMAKEYLSPLPSILPDLNRPYYNLAVIALIEKDTTAAMDLLQKAYFLNRNDYLPALALGDIYYQRGGKEKSTAFTVIRYYQEALRNWLSGSTIHRVRADIKYQNSIAITNDLIPKDLLQSIKTQLDFPQIAGRIAEMYTKVGNKNGAQYYQSLSQQPLQKIDAVAIR